MSKDTELTELDELGEILHEYGEKYLEYADMGRQRDVRGMCKEADELNEIRAKINKSYISRKAVGWVEMLQEMAGIGEPFELFEPKLWYDKLGDSCWKCEVHSNCMIMWSGQGDTMQEAVEACYKDATKSADIKKRLLEE
jgi:hypothetical protein